VDKAPAVRVNSALTVVTTDVDEARRIGADFFYPQRLDVLDRNSALAMTMHAGRIGPVSIGDLHYGTDVRISCWELATSYHVNIPLTGHLVSRHGRSSVIASPSTAAVYGPVGDTVLERWTGDCRQLCVKIDRSALEAALTDWAGQEIDGPVGFDAQLDLSNGPGRSWADMVIMLYRQLRHSDSLVHQPLVAAPLARGLLTGLLTAAGHEYRAVLDEPAQPCRSAVISSALDYMHGHAADPITTADIAAHCCISVRTLQEGFHRHVGQAPLQYLRAIRLHRAHADLASANPFDETVASIAHRWGFSHLGRFAAAHEAEYGEPPSRTLRRGS
jgi:AraC-like DNA-binding protein